MNVNQLMFRNLKKNLKNYYLYIFALIFSVALYFAFVTLQFDPSMDAAKGSVKGAAAIKTASILLIAIVSIFLLYANKIFMKRRSKEIGLLQLIGMTKSNVFRLLTVENLLLYFSSLLIGVLIGFAFSKLILMILFKITGVKAIATLHFSIEAFVQTIIVFSAVYLFITFVNYVFIKKQSILSLFRAISKTENKRKNISVWEIIIGIVGIVSILSGYYVSSKLFDGDFTTTNQLFLAMAYTLASVIIGTYLFYKGSVRLISSLIRKKKNGHLTINDVVSLSSIMFRMNSNALLLTIITTVSALAIGLLSLSYISYYSAEKTAKSYFPNDFSIVYPEDAETFTQTLTEENIDYKETKIEVIQVNANITNVFEKHFEELNFDDQNVPISVISDASVKGIDLKKDESMLAGYSDLFQNFMPLKETGKIELKGKTTVIPLENTKLQKEAIISWYFTGGGFATLVVDDSIFTHLKQDLVNEIQKESSMYIGIDIIDDSKQEKALELFRDLSIYKQMRIESQLETINEQKKTMGLGMFIVGFLGLTFLITSGCILYFKQVDESEEEKGNYTILRKLGFTEDDLLKGVKMKQLFNFGIPLIVGLSHSYFAVRSGWFFFGTELWTPMLLVMVVYAALYSIFGILSVLYYKKVIKAAL